MNINSQPGQPHNFITYLFLTADEQTVNISFDVLGADDDSLFHKDFTNIPLKINRTTILRGELFTSSSSGSFYIEPDWLDDEILEF